jgi:hypothetical protein
MTEVLTEPSTFDHRFWAKVQVGGVDDCWPFTGAPSQPYGKFKMQGRQQTPHRVAFYLVHGRWPEPDCLHSCDVPRCCNPRHLREGDDLDNMRDQIERGRRADRAGQRSPLSKLTDQQVAEIRGALARDSQRGAGRRLARAYGVSEATISEIRNRRHWR